MKSVLSIVLVMAMVTAIACHAAVRPPVDEGFDSCDDPRIVHTPRLTLNESGEISARLETRENRVESAPEATALFAHASVSGGFIWIGPTEAADHTSIDAFVRETDFAHDELMLVGETLSGGDGYVGSISQYGKTALVSHQCGQSGGAPPPTAHWIAVYRIPRGNLLIAVGCGNCGEPVPCCPP